MNTNRGNPRGGEQGRNSDAGEWDLPDALVQAMKTEAEVFPPADLTKRILAGVRATTRPLRAPWLFRGLSLLAVLEAGWLVLQQPGAWERVLSRRDSARAYWDLGTGHVRGIWTEATALLSDLPWSTVTGPLGEHAQWIAAAVILAAVFSAGVLYVEEGHHADS